MLYVRSGHLRQGAWAHEVTFGRSALETYREHAWITDVGFSIALVLFSVLGVATLNLLPIVYHHSRHC